jgi:hypothetical protein
MSKLSTLEKVQKMMKSALEEVNTLIEKFASTEVAKKVVKAAEEVATGEGEAKEAAATPAAVASVESDGEAKKARKTKGGVNKSEKIREYFDEHGMAARNKDIIEYIKKTYNTEVGPAHVSIVRKNMTEGKAAKAGPKKTKASKAPKAKATAVAKAPKVKKAQKSTLGQLPMGTLCTRLLNECGSREGLKLAEVTDLVIKSGYPYSGAKGRDGVLQNVYQALHSLAKKGSHVGYKDETPVVLHDPTSKRYRLNPKAKKKVA